MGGGGDGEEGGVLLEYGGGRGAWLDAIEGGELASIERREITSSQSLDA